MSKNNQCRCNQLAKIVIKRLYLICLHTVHAVVITATLFGQCFFFTSGHKKLRWHEYGTPKPSDGKE